MMVLTHKIQLAIISLESFSFALKTRNVCSLKKKKDLIMKLKGTFRNDVIKD